VRNLQVIGEAARRLSPATRDAHPEVPWSEAIGMRHVLVHDYFAVRLDVVWDVVERDLPELGRRIDAILRASS
jgi:uncharacterized protein with HEPN domain